MPPFKNRALFVNGVGLSSLPDAHSSSSSIFPQRQYRDKLGKFTAPVLLCYMDFQSFQVLMSNGYDMRVGVRYVSGNGTQFKQLDISKSCDI